MSLRGTQHHLISFRELSETWELLCEGSEKKTPKQSALARGPLDVIGLELQRLGWRTHHDRKTKFVLVTDSGMEVWPRTWKQEGTNFVTTLHLHLL